MKYAIIIIALLVVFFIILAVNAARCKPKSTDELKQKKSPIDINTDEAAERLAQMIRCKTVSHKDKTKDDKDEFDKFRALLPALYPTVEKMCEKQEIAGGLLYRYKGKSSAAPSVLMAHFDVVDVDADNWEADPFAGVIKDGFLWGRGTLDTKCSLFGILESAERLLKNGFVPENDIYLSFGCNEEVAGDCTPSIVEALKERGIRPAFVLDEGGTVLSSSASVFPHDIAVIGIAEKGPMDVELTVKGESGHSSQPPVHTAVGQLSKDICKIENKQFKMKMNYPVKAMFSAIAPHTSFFARLVLANTWCFGPMIRLACKFNKTAAALMRTSMAFTQLSGSNGANVLPAEAKAVVNVRLAPGCKSTDAVEHMKKAANDPKLSFRIVNFSEATPCAKAEGAYWEKLQNAVHENFDNIVVSPYLMMGGTDSRFFSEICDNIFKFAPTFCGGGLLKTIHSDNERIRLDNIPGLVGFFESLMLSI